VVRRFVSVAFVVACACSSKSADPPQPREDRHEPQAAPSKLALRVMIGSAAGDGSAATWTDATFAATPKLAGTASDGEARDTWSLRELVHAHVGPTARVTAVIGPDGSKPIDAAAWADASRVPILHTTKRGTLKFRWADAAGKWGETIVRDVSA